MTLIVGAGISVPPPTGAPDFRALRDRFLGLADPALDASRFQLDELSPEQVFDALDDGRPTLRRAVRRELWWLCEPNEPNANHYAVAALLAAGARVWTPNFDTMIERAASRLALEVLPVVPGDPVKPTDSRPWLFKPHGTFPYTGDPPREPTGHDYRLLFQASAVWVLDEAWGERLREDVRDREVLLFGYRGADPDLTPIMLSAFEDARSVTWWEFPSAHNFARLERLLANARNAAVHAGDPSAELQAFAQRVAPHVVPQPRRAAVRRPPDLAPIELSHMSRAQVLGQFRGAAVARRHLVRAALFDPPSSRPLALFRLVRSMGFDLPWMREPLVLLVGGLLQVPRLRERPRLNELYATMIDARPSRPADRRAIARLLSIAGSDRAEILVRAASAEKLHGELDAAVEHATAALEDAQRRRRPRLEAMAVYNLTWAYRKQADFDRRAELVDRYRDRLPHIGFNWAAWLGLDEVLLALHFGDAAGARRLMGSPFLAYARSLAHPNYELDDSVSEVLVRWHERGPAAVGDELAAILRRRPIRPLIRPPFTAIDALIAYADHARAIGDHAAMRRRLRRARRRTASRLQLAEVELVEEVARGEPARLRALSARTRREGFGLVDVTAAAVAVWIEGAAPRAPGVVYRPELPLPASY